MKKFIIHRNSIMEVECAKLTPVEDPSIAFLPPGEYKARIEAPATLHEKVETKMVKPVWFSFAFFDTIEAAKKKAEDDIRVGLERNKKKSGVDFTEADIQKQLADIQVITLGEHK